MKEGRKLFRPSMISIILVELYPSGKSISGFVRLNVDEFAPLFAGGENNHSIDKCVECVVLTDTDIQAGMVLSATLAFEDIAGFAIAAAVDFHPKAFAF